jgi:UDP-glucose:glycoprotein glucosyltransferase
MASSIISASQIPDPSETGLFDVPPRARVRNYRFMDGAHTYAIFQEGSSPYSLVCSSAFEFGDNATALFQLGVLLDPLSEAAQKWSSLMDVRCLSLYNTYSTLNS